MMNTANLEKYVKLIELIHRYSGQKRDAIMKLWTTTYGQEDISRQTFCKWLSDIYKIFNIDIRPNSHYEYSIRNPEELTKNTATSWILNTYGTMAALQVNLQLKDRIVVQDVPSSQVYLKQTLDAMAANKVIKLTYQNYRIANPYEIDIEPYCLKLFHNRWYMLGKEHAEGRDKLKLYALDRFKGMETEDETFEMPEDFDANQYFGSYFGIWLDPDKKAEKIVIRADYYQANYLKSLPLHQSQKEIYTCEDYSDFELYLRPELEFVLELLHSGNMVEVLEPQSLRKEMRRMTEEMFNIYKDDTYDA